MPGCQVNAHIKRINKLISVVNYRRFSHELFLYLSDAANMAFVKILLIETYFPAKANEFVGRKAGGVGCFHDPEAYLLNVQEARKKIIKIQREEKIYVRSGLFKRLVPQVYQQTCAISGMQLGSTVGYTFIDACHIAICCCLINQKKRG
jgi:putative restriction endonuclease